MHLSSRAYDEIEKIFLYIAIEKLSPENAKGQTDRIWKKLHTLDVFPQSHQERLTGEYAGKGYRQLLIDNYLAIYKIDEQNKIVKVLTITLIKHDDFDYTEWRHKYFDAMSEGEFGREASEYAKTHPYKGRGQVI